MSREFPQVVPMPTYEDVDRASKWLCDAFGFSEQARFDDGQGRVTTAILAWPRGGAIMLGWTGSAYESPRRHRDHCNAARKWHEVPYIVDGVLVSVDNVDEHCAKARKAGAVVLSEPETTPNGRLYRVEDIEGHRWMFMQET
jgi:uncharacterized glyoxalase superfamily protein PhnB